MANGQQKAQENLNAFQSCRYTKKRWLDEYSAHMNLKNESE